LPPSAYYLLWNIPAETLIGYGGEAMKANGNGAKSVRGLYTRCTDPRSCARWLRFIDVEE